jgi:hypothetical protein
MEIAPFAPEHLDDVHRLCEQEASSTLAEDRKRLGRSLSAPVSLCLVAISDTGVIAFAQALTDGSIQAYLSRLLVAPGSRRQGISPAGCCVR